MASKKQRLHSLAKVQMILGILGIVIAIFGSLALSYLVIGHDQSGYSLDDPPQSYMYQYVIDMTDVWANYEEDLNEAYYASLDMTDVEYNTLDDQSYNSLEQEFLLKYGHPTLPTIVDNLLQMQLLVKLSRLIIFSIAFILLFVSILTIINAQFKLQS